MLLDQEADGIQIALLEIASSGGGSKAAIGAPWNGPPFLLQEKRVNGLSEISFWIIGALPLLNEADGKSERRESGGGGGIRTHEGR
jgi:hypothetical protein